MGSITDKPVTIIGTPDFLAKARDAAKVIASAAQKTAGADTPVVAPKKSQIQVFGQTTKPATLQPADHLPLVTTKSAHLATTTKPATAKPQVDNHAGNAAQQHSGNPFAKEKGGSVWGTLTRYYKGFEGLPRDKQIALAKKYIAQFASDVQKDKITMFYRDARNALQSTIFTSSIIQNDKVSTGNICHAAHVGLTTGRIESRNAAAAVLASNLGKINKDAVGCVSNEIVKHGPAKAILEASTHVYEVHESKQVEVARNLQQTLNKQTLSGVNINIVNQYGKLAKSAELPIHRIITDSSVKNGLHNVLQYSATKIHKMDKTHQAEAVGITLGAAHKTKDIQTVRIVAREYDAFDKSARAEIRAKITREPLAQNDWVTNNLLKQADYRIQNNLKPLADLNEKYFSDPYKTIETKTVVSETDEATATSAQNNTTSAESEAQVKERKALESVADSQSLSMDEKKAVLALAEGKVCPTSDVYNKVLKLINSNKISESSKQVLFEKIKDSYYMKSMLSQIPTLGQGLQLLLAENYIGSNNAMALKDKVDMFTNLTAKKELIAAIEKENEKNHKAPIKKVA